MTQITWGGTSGDWATGTDWIGGKAPTSSEDALLAGTGTYTVTVTSADIAQSVSLDDANATLAINGGGALTIGSTFTATAGTIEVNGNGTISGGTISSAGGDFEWLDGTLDGVTFEGALSLSATNASLNVSSKGLIVRGAGGAGNGTIDLTGSNVHLYLEGTQTLDKATVDIGNASGYDVLDEYDLAATGAVLTLGAGLTIDHTGTYVDIDGSGSVGDGIVNKGVINATFGGGLFIINPLAFTNDGTITVADGDTVDLEPTTFTNTAGVITVESASTLELDCNLTTAELGSLTNTGAVEIWGVLTNTGDTLSIGTGTKLGALTLEGNSGVISGGTISDAGSGLVAGGGTLDGVTYEGPLNLSASNSSLEISSKGLIAEGAGGVGNGTIDLTGSNVHLYLEGTQTLDKATIDIGESGSYSVLDEYDLTATGAVLTLGAGLIIDHTGHYAEIDGSGSTGDGIVNKGVIDATFGGGELIINPLAFTNDGTITIADGDTVDLEPTTFTNAHGEITVDGTSTLELDCNLTTAELGSLTNAGTVSIYEMLTNTGASLKIGTGSALGTLTLESDGVISGGVISDAGSGLIASGGTLDGVTYEGLLDLSASNASLDVSSKGLIVVGPGGVGNGMIDLTGSNAHLYLEGTHTLDKATVDIGNTSGYSVLYEYDLTATGAVLTLGAGLTIDHTGRYAEIDGSGSKGDGMVNKGVINATLGGGQLIINPLAFTNDGTVTIANGDTVYLEPTTFTNAAGVITVDNTSTLELDCNLTTAELGSLTNAGAVEIELTLTNTRATLKVGTGSALGTLTLESDGVISGGVISDAGSGLIAGGGTLDGVTYEGLLNLSANNASLDIGDKGLVATGAGGVGAGTIDLTGANAHLYLEGTQTLDKATVKFGNTNGYGVLDEYDLAEHGAVLTLGAGLTIDHTGTYAEIDGSSFAGDKVINEGVINATLGGGQFLIDVLSFTNDGTIAVSGGDAVVDYSALNNGAGKLSVGANSTMDFDNGAVFSDQGTLADAGTVALQSGGNDTELLVLAGGLTLDGGGTLGMSGTKAVITGISSAAIFTNVNDTITGEGFIGRGELTLHNEAGGVIDASIRGQLAVNTQGKTLINAGVMESAVAGAFLILNTTTIANAGGTIAAAGGVVDLQNVEVIGGTLNGTRVLNVNTGSSTLDGAATGPVDLSATLQVLAGTSLTMEGTISGSGSVDLYGSGKLVIGATGATLTGGIHVGDNGIVTSTIVGATATAALINVDGHFDCVGQMGDGSMVLDNEAAGVILDAQSVALTINTGAKTITNAGTIASSGTGGVVVASAVANTGILQAGVGTLKLDGVVTGAGTGKIAGGTLDAAATADFEEDVTFVGGSTGTLELGASQAYSGTVAGFSTSGATALDLADIHFIGGTTTASYSGTAAGGVLTVTSGAEVAKIHLAGNYLASKWTLSIDGHGGTTVVDPVGGAAAARAPQSTTFVQSMAGLGNVQAATGSAPEAWLLPPMTLAAPGTRLA